MIDPTILMDIIIFASDGWNTESHPYKKLEYGKWELIIPADKDGNCPIKHGSIIKVFFSVVESDVLASIMYS